MDFEIGDKALVEGSARRVYAVTVERFTPTQIVVKDSMGRVERFNKKTLAKVGSASSWDWSALRKYEGALLQKYLKRKYVLYCRDFEYNTLEMDDLLKVVIMLQEIKK